MANVIRTSTKEDLMMLKCFLEEANLSTEGIENFIEYFVLIENEEGNIVASLGLEPVKEIGVLRSLVVHSNIQEADLLTIFQHVYKLAKKKELSTIYLSTNKSNSISLFQMMGFNHVDKVDLPKEFELSTSGNQILAMENIIFMKKFIQ